MNDNFNCIFTSCEITHTDRGLVSGTKPILRQRLTETVIPN